MPCFVLQTTPDGRVFFTCYFTDRVEALGYIRKQLAAKSLMASAATYTIYHCESGESFNEEKPA